MDDSNHPSPGPAARLAGYAPAACHALGTLLLWLVLLDFNLVNASGSPLDDSWAQGLGYLLKHRFQAGADYAFTYGPLGYFTTWAYDPDLYGYKFAWELGAKLAYAITLMALLRHFPSRPARFVGWAAFLLAGELIFTVPDTAYLFFLVALAVLLVRSGADFRRPATPAAVALCAVIALTKFTCFLYALAAVTVLTARGLATGQRARAFLPALFFFGSVVLLWSALGQSAANLPRYLYGSLQIAAGYGEAMALPGDVREVGWALGVALTLAAALVTFRPARHANPRQAAAALLIGLGLFWQWKHGFVRHDPNHACTFFSFAALVPFLFPAAFPTYRWRRGPRVVFLPLAVLLAVLGLRADLKALAIPYPADPLGVVRQAGERLALNTRKACTPAMQKRRLDEERERLAAPFDLPRVRAEVGREAVDLFSYEQRLLLWNRLNWRPRPVLQSYSAYTAYLLRANATFFKGGRAPGYVLFQFEPVDAHPPTLEDGPALLALLKHYRPVFVEKGFLLLKRWDGGLLPGPQPPHPIRERTVGLNEEVSLEDTGPGPLRVAIDLRATLEGRLRQFLYKTPPLFLRLKTADGRQTVYRLIPEMAKAGFLLNPLVTSTRELVQLYGPERCGLEPGRRVVSMSVWAEHRGRHQFRPEYRLTVEGLPGLCGRLPAAEVDPLCFPSFRTFPTKVTTPEPIRVVEDGGREAVLVHPDGAMTFDVPAGARRVTGRFGIARRAYEEGRTDGVLFVVEYVPDANEPRVLYRRHLDPVAVAGDGSAQILDVELPAGARGRVVLRTTNLPGRTREWDWSYWSEIAIR